MDQLSRQLGCVLCGLLLALPAAAPAATKPQAACVVMLHSSGDDDDAADDTAADQAEPDMDVLRRRYEVLAADGQGGQVPAPTPPDLSGYTAAAVQARLGQPAAGEVSIGQLLSEPGFRPFTTAAGQGLSVFARRQKGGLQAIFIERGLVDPPTLARRLPPSAFVQTAPGVYLARLPILVRHGATLAIGPETRELRLSREGGALLANEGRLFVRSSAITGWSERHNAPAQLEDAREFRPFLVSWGGSATYISGSHIAHLGYAMSRAYGLSFSQYGPDTVERRIWPRPGGWVLDSEVEDLWYGFYSWQADDVVLRGNNFHDNIRYGIDPHAGGRGLIIADNTVSGTRLKHGIILSQQIDGAWLIGNRSFRNGISGIVLSRDSEHNVLLDNTTHENAADGVVISESPHNLVLRSVSSGNQHNGVRVRNSADVRIQDGVFVANGLSAVYGVARPLCGGADPQRQPGDRALSLSITGGQMSGNGTGPINVDQPDRLTLYGIDLRVPQRALGYRLGGVLLAFQTESMDILLRQKRAVVLQPRQDPAAIPNTLSFRET